MKLLNVPSLNKNQSDKTIYINTIIELCIIICILYIFMVF